jgi:hypothetical protein
METIKFDLPDLEPRLKERFQTLVREHLHVGTPTSPGTKAAPAAPSTFANTMGAWRFYNNPSVSLPGLVQPLHAEARRAIVQDCEHYGLVMNDWSDLTYTAHTRKKDRVRLRHRRHLGYGLQTSLLVSDRTGQPLAPLVINLRAKPGVYSTRWEGLRRPSKLLDELSERLDYLVDLHLGRPLVEVVDREGDSVGHYRRWAKAGHLFLVRGKLSRRVQWEGQSRKLGEIVPALKAQGAFRFARQVQFKGRVAEQYVAQTEVVLDRPARPKSRHRGKVKSRSVPGEPLTLRLVVSEVRSAAGKVLASWLLLSNVPPSVSAEQLALWYYWRWQIESFFKLAKSAGHQLEHWQQESAEAVARRLLVASMACVLVWKLARDPSPEAAQTREMLVRLSGRQTKRQRPCTVPAMLAGLWVLLALLDLLVHEDLALLKNQVDLWAAVLGLVSDN